MLWLLSSRVAPEKGSIARKKGSSVSLSRFLSSTNRACSSVLSPAANPTAASSTAGFSGEASSATSTRRIENLWGRSLIFGPFERVVPFKGAKTERAPQLLAQFGQSLFDHAVQHSFWVASALVRLPRR